MDDIRSDRVLSHFVARESAKPKPPQRYFVSNFELPSQQTNADYNDVSKRLNTGKPIAPSQSQTNTNYYMNYLTDVSLDSPF